MRGQVIYPGHLISSHLISFRDRAALSEPNAFMAIGSTTLGLSSLAWIALADCEYLELAPFTNASCYLDHLDYPPPSQKRTS